MGPVEKTAELSEAELREFVPELQQITDKYKRSEAIQKALFEISELASCVSDLDTLYRSVHEIIGELMHAKNFFIAYCEDDSLEFAYFVDEFDELTIRSIPAERLSKGSTGYILRTGEPLFLRKETEAEQSAELGIESMGADAVDWIGVPLKRGSQVIGAMVVQSYSEQFRYSEEDKELLMFVSQHIMTTVDRVKHREVTERTIRERTKQLRQINEELQEEIQERQRIESLQQALFEISELSANVGAEISEFYSDLHGILARLLSAPNCYIATLNRDTDELEFPYFSDELSNEAKPRSLGKGLTEYVLRTGQASLIDALAAAKLTDAGELAAGVASSMHKDNTSWLGSPLVVDGEVTGVIAVQTYDPKRYYTQPDLELLRFVSHHIAVAMERRRAAEEIQHYNQELTQMVQARTEELNRVNQDLQKQIDERKEIELKLIHDAHHDNLTGLPNRAMFTSRLDLALANKKRHRANNFAVLFVDLDRFKLINDTLGHQAGDDFLVEVSSRIQDCIRSHDLLARMGGDEFVVLLDDFEYGGDVEEVARRIIEAISTPFVLKGKEMYSGASIGIAFLEHWYQDSDEIIRDADAAMYRAKALGRGKYVIFDQGMRDTLLREMELESEFRRSLRDGRFDCFFQTVQNLKDGTPIYDEMYIRWEHPVLGRVKREQLWQVAEHAGLTVEVDNYVLSNALELLQDKQQQATLGEDHRIAVNLSIHHLLQSDLVKQLIERVKASGVAASHLVFEFDENDLNRRSQAVIPALRKLKHAGFTLVLDNFGSGLASLSYLYSFPFDFVKIDHRFINSIPRSDKNLKLVQSVQIISENLHFKLIAEGVKNQAQLQALESVGCEYAQGSFLSPAEAYSKD